MTDSKRSILEAKWAAAAAEAGADAVGDADAADEASEEADAAAVAEGDLVEAGEPQPLEQEVASLRDQLLRQQAEMANFRRRTQQEGGERAEGGRIEVIQRLLPVLDDFERAIDADPEAEGYREGVELILKSLRDLLASFGVTRLDPQGEEFDPTQHDAMQQLPTDEVAAGRVASVYKPGYRVGERLLRPAMVAVARELAGDADEDP